MSEYFGNKTYTLTFGDQAENHAGMQKIGTPLQNGLTLKELKKAKLKFENLGYVCYLHKMKCKEFLGEIFVIHKAYILIIKNGIEVLASGASKASKNLKVSNNLHKKTFDEHNSMKYDKKALMRGKVVNKIARHNLCFANFSQKAEFSKGKGTIIDFNNLKYTNNIRKNLKKFFGKKASNLVAEGNYYYDNTKCGIGFHGDSERKIVIAIRLGRSMPIVFQWYHKNKPVGKQKKFNIKGGDVYVMSEKAVGYDWKCSSKYTLRHAAGCNKYTTINKF